MTLLDQIEKEVCSIFSYKGSLKRSGGTKRVMEVKKNFYYICSNYYGISLKDINIHLGHKETYTKWLEIKFKPNEDVLDFYKSDLYLASNDIMNSLQNEVKQLKEVIKQQYLIVDVIDSNDYYIIYKNNNETKIERL